MLVNIFLDDISWILPVGLLDRLDDSLGVKRTDTPQVDNLCRDTLLREQLSSLHAVSDHLAVGNDGDVTTGTLDLGLADGEQEVV